jgi:hypothetical protein
MQVAAMTSLFRWMVTVQCWMATTIKCSNADGVAVESAPCFQATQSRRSDATTRCYDLHFKASGSDARETAG